MTRKPIRQGDVLLVPVDVIPVGSKPIARDHGRVILAYGEVTGHAHAIVSENAILSEADNRRFLAIVGAEVELTHEEHGTVVIAPGSWEQKIQYEYDPRAAQRVLD